MENISFRPIAVIRTDFKEKFGIPRQSGLAPLLEGRIVFEPEFRSADALDGIEGFSHLWLIFDFSLAHRDGASLKVRPPRLGGNKRVGVFASRSPFRPNPIGLSCVKLQRIEHTSEGDVLVVSGIDMLDGTPILDIKPYIPLSDCRPEATGSYSEDGLLHTLEVNINDDLYRKIPPDKRDALKLCLSLDPRPAYHDDGRKYGMSFAGMEVSFTVDGNSLTVLQID